MVLTRVLLLVLAREVQAVRTVTAVMRSLVSARKSTLVSVVRTAACIPLCCLRCVVLCPVLCGDDGGFCFWVSLVSVTCHAHNMRISRIFVATKESTKEMQSRKDGAYCARLSDLENALLQ